MSLISLRSVLKVLFLSIVVLVLIDHGLPSRLPLHIQGEVDKRFERVKDVFTRNFNDGWERGGASLAVYEHGRKVVDLWGGYADASAMRKWKEDTIQVTFSTTKGVAAICVAMLVDRGYLSYDDLVIKHWPEFGQHGKDNAGLVYFDEDLTVDDIRDHSVMSKKFEEQKPHWPPGTATGYHAYTYGWLVDQVIRRADPYHRSIGQFVREELHDKYSIDFHIGLPSQHASRVARLTAPSFIDRVSEILTDLRLAGQYRTLLELLKPNSLFSRALANLPFFEMIRQPPYQLSSVEN